ncbi:MAG: MauE/DoxX family redox-associated membrane protein [Flavobacteriales bacterium]
MQNRALRIFIGVCRILVGATFIISGLIKANDPIGFGIKLEEYFAASALGLPWLDPFSLPLAMLACLAEIVLGFAVLTGGRMKLATWALLLFTLFFGWLTAYTATCDPQAKYAAVENGVEVMRDVTCVTDCGCFGDAMKGSVGRSLTPWESFSKDMVLLVFVLPLFFLRKKIGFNTWGTDLAILPVALVLLAFYCWVFSWWFPLLFAVMVILGYLLIKWLLEPPRSEWATAVWVAVVTLAFMWHCYAHLPLRDYRPYAIGKSIPEQMTMGTAPVQDIFVKYKNTATGEEKEFDSKGAYPWDDSTWVYVDRRVEVKVPGIDSPVKDFLLTDLDGNDRTADVLEEDRPVLVLVIRNVKDARTGNMATINKLAQDAEAHGWAVFGLTSSGFTDVDEFKFQHQAAFEFLSCDDVTLKTVVRSNPGVLVLSNGVVRGKWNGNDAPTFAAAEKALK